MKTAFLLLMSLSDIVFAYSQQTDSLKQYGVGLTLLDLPYQYYAAKTVNQKPTATGYAKGYANPSMKTSMSASNSVYTAAHYGIKELFKTNGKKGFLSTVKKLAYPVAVFYSDQLLAFVPGGDGWLHEEFHRAVMTRAHVNSFDDMNRVPLGSELVSVNRIQDEDLIRFKKQDAAGFTRMQEAGIEGEYLLIDQMQRNNFFSGQKLLHEFHYILTTANSIAYVRESANPKTVDVETDKMNQNELTIPQRDFTGFDFSGWVYDLFRPGEPYEQRGAHPSGVGINRYRKTTDLTADELSFLKKQGNLQLLNLISPMMFGFRRIGLGNQLRGNFAIRHFLTSFGDDIQLNVFVRSPHYHYVFAYHQFQNKEHSFPALQAEILEHPTKMWGKKYVVDYKILIGLQPSDQRFISSRADFLGLLGFKVRAAGFNKIKPYFELEAKTKGWVAGNTFLSSNASVCAGLAYTWE
jgi:hypothetical protein